MEHAKRKKTHGFRQLPVKGTGGSGSYRYWRRPKTTQERRFCFTEPDLVHKQAFFRKKRGSKALPCVWDDLVRSDYDIRSWKYHRKTQWKIK